MLRPSVLLVSFIFVVPLGACKAKPAEPAGFVKAERMTESQDLPFHRAWRHPQGNFANYDRIVIAPVDTTHLLDMTWWQQRGRDIRKDLDELATFTKTELESAFRDGEDNHFELVANAGDKSEKTVILEFALVQVVPSKAILEAISWGVPYGGGAAIQQTTKSSVSMEGRFIDAATGRVLLSFADREGEKARPFDLKGVSWYAHSRGIIKDWAQQLVKVANQEPGKKIADTKAFTIKPW